MINSRGTWVALSAVLIGAAVLGVSALFYFRMSPQENAPEEFVANHVGEGPSTRPVPGPVPVPASIAEILSAHETPLPEIEAWSSAWTAAHSTTPPGGDAGAPSDPVALTVMIDRSDLSAMDCLHFGELVRRGGDRISANVWDKAGVLRADKELAKVPHDDFSGTPLLEALGRANNAMWGNLPDAAPLIETIANLGMKYDRTAPWDQRKEWSRIAHAAAVDYQGRRDEAWTEAQGMLADLHQPGSKWTGEQSGELHMFAARLLLRQRESAAAAEQYELAAAADTRKAQAATMQAVQVYQSLNRIDDANRVLDAYTKTAGETPMTKVMKEQLSKAAATTRSAR